MTILCVVAFLCFVIVHSRSDCQNDNLEGRQLYRTGTAQRRSLLQMKDHRDDSAEDPTKEDPDFHLQAHDPAPPHYKDTPQMCTMPLIGTRNRRMIPDNAITASSHNPNDASEIGPPASWEPDKSRMDNSLSCWLAAKSDLHQWIQWDFGTPKRIHIIQTKGRLLRGAHKDRQLVTEYNISYTLDGKHWTFYPKTLPGNKIRFHVHENKFEPHLIATKVKLHPTKWKSLIAMRVEMLGCDAPPCYGCTSCEAVPGTLTGCSKNLCGQCVGADPETATWPCNVTGLCQCPAGVHRNFDWLYPAPRNDSERQAGKGTPCHHCDTACEPVPGAVGCSVEMCSRCLHVEPENALWPCNVTGVCQCKTYVPKPPTPPQLHDTTLPPTLPPTPPQLHNTTLPPEHTSSTHGEQIHHDRARAEHAHARHGLDHSSSACSNCSSCIAAKIQRQAEQEGVEYALDWQCAKCAQGLHTGWPCNEPGLCICGAAKPCPLGEHPIEATIISGASNKLPAVEATTLDVPSPSPPCPPTPWVAAVPGGPVTLPPSAEATKR